MATEEAAKPSPLPPYPEVTTLRPSSSASCALLFFPFPFCCFFLRAVVRGEDLLFGAGFGMWALLMRVSWGFLSEKIVSFGQKIVFFVLAVEKWDGVRFP
jgi:hypothetical protein